MAASPQLDRFLGMIRARAAEVRKTIEDDRLSYEWIMSSLQMDDDIKTERVGAGGVQARAWPRLVSSDAKRNGRTI